MNKVIRLSAPQSTGENTLRLHMFAGRYLSEQEFDLMQAYVDERCEDLLLHQRPGIVEGLHVSVNENAEDISLRVEPGYAIGGDGRAIACFSALDIMWPSLIEAYKARTQAADAPERGLRGFYYLSIKRSAATVYETEDRDPCSRVDLNPLHDSRIETYATLDLQFISAVPGLMAMSKTRAANRICATQVNTVIFDGDTGAVPLALLKIEDDALVWADKLAGRYHSQADAGYHTFLRHWQNLVEAGVAGGRSEDTLASNLGVDFIPSAGSFPANLLGDIAGSQNQSDASQWNLPEIKFASADLHIELLPIPANSHQGIIEHEFNRGYINLVHGQQDRLRLMVAVDEEDYRPNLMDLPQIDSDLADDLYQRYVSAASDYNAWANQYYAIYHNIDRDVVFDGDLPDEDSQVLFDSLYKVSGPNDAFANIDSEAQRKALGLPVGQAATQSASDFFNQLISQRRAALSDNDTLPRPYSLEIPESPEDLADINPELIQEREAGLYRLQRDYQESIRQIEDDLETSFDLLDEMNDFISVQRQQLDSITVSFAALAGGVQGDGSGLNLMRWTSNAQILPLAATQSDEGS